MPYIVLVKGQRSEPDFSPQVEEFSNLGFGQDLLGRKSNLVFCQLLIILSSQFLRRAQGCLCYSLHHAWLWLFPLSQLCCRKQTRSLPTLRCLQETNHSLSGIQRRQWASQCVWGYIKLFSSYMFPYYFGSKEWEGTLHLFFVLTILIRNNFLCTAWFN